MLNNPVYSFQPMFYVVDEIHCEYSEPFASFENAENEIRHRCAFPWDAPPNRAPCRNWRKCGRKYQIVEAHDSDNDNLKSATTDVCEVREFGIVWHGGFKPGESFERKTQGHDG